jgi:hypothetical protein
MSGQKQPEIVFEHDDFESVSLDDELRLDEHCRELLKRFYLNLVENGMTQQQASELAFSADLYLRDFLVDFVRRNVVRPQPGIVRRFAATWFITHTLDPEMRILERHLDGIRELYRFLHGQHLISSEELVFLEDEAAQTDYYRRRIESFLAIVGDGYFAWEAECPLRD